jgi:hypothetical protein
MTIPWHSLYLPCDDPQRVIKALRSDLTQQHYTLYDPFSGLLTRAYTHTVKLFVSPARSGWTRIVGAPDPAVVPSLVAIAPVLWIALDGDQEAIAIYSSPGADDGFSPLIPYLRAGLTPADLKAALDGNAPSTDAADEEARQDFAADALAIALPAEARSQMVGIDRRRAAAAFRWMATRALRQAGGSVQQARELLNHAPKWNSPGGRRIKAVMACLTVPSDWREPDFATVREAYQLYAGRLRRPDAILHPGDEDAMNTVPDALDYTPIYAGKV